MSLGRDQREFSLDVARLINFIYECGYECTLGDAYRDPRTHAPMGEKGVYGHRNSAHKHRLAIDLNLFKDMVYLRETEDHRQFGEFWKRLRPEHRWGGDFPRPDGNHYSRNHGNIS